MLRRIVTCGLLALGGFALLNQHALATVLLQYDASSGLTPSQLPHEPLDEFRSIDDGGWREVDSTCQRRRHRRCSRARNIFRRPSPPALSSAVERRTESNSAPSH